MRRPVSLNLFVRPLVHRIDSAGVSDYIVLTFPKRSVHMKSRIIRVGNSRGVRLPKPLLAEAGLSEEIDIRAEAGRIIIESAKRPRSGWAEAAREMAARGDDELLDEPTSTDFDLEEWRW